jgi:cytochrome P450 monooxygenase
VTALETERKAAVTASEELPVLEYEEPVLLGINPYMRALQAEGPVVRVRTPAGDAAWLVTRHKEVRALLRDRRIGRSHRDPDNAPRYIDNPMMDLLRTANDFANEHEIHNQMRALLSPYFAGRHIVSLETRLSAIIEDRVEMLAREQPPVDMKVEFAEPLTMQMICELLGVPQSDRESFPALVHQVSGVADLEGAVSGKDTLFGYFCDLVARKRADPGEDILSGMVTAGVDDVQIASLGLMLLYAGYGSTASHTSLGIIRIGSDLGLRDELVKNPELMNGAVEELLRTASSGGFSLPHYAREDIEVGGVTIRAGDLVLVDYALANLDETAFPEPDRVDVNRKPNPHVAFAHGMWNCMGAPLARMQLRLSFNALLRRFPDMRLAVSLSEIGRSSNHLGGEVTNLMVTW